MNDLINNFNGYQISLRNKEIKILYDSFVNYIKETFLFKKANEEKNKNKVSFKNSLKSFISEGKDNIHLNVYSNEEKKEDRKNNENNNYNNNEKFKNIKKNDNFNFNFKTIDKSQKNEFDIIFNSEENPDLDIICDHALKFSESLMPHKLEKQVHEWISAIKSQEFYLIKENTYIISENTNWLYNLSLFSIANLIQCQAIPI